MGPRMLHVSQMHAFVVVPLSVSAIWLSFFESCSLPEHEGCHLNPISVFSRPDRQLGTNVPAR